MFLIKILGYIFVPADRYINDKAFFIFFLPDNNLPIRVEFPDMLSTFFFFLWYNVLIKTLVTLLCR